MRSSVQGHFESINDYFENFLSVLCFQWFRHGENYIVVKLRWDFWTGSVTHSLEYHKLLSRKLIGQQQLVTTNKW